MKKIFVSILMLLLITICSGAQAATLTVDVDGIDTLLPDTIWNYQINFDVSGGTAWYTPGSVVFNIATQHVGELFPNVLPGVLLPNWNLESSSPLDQLRILADDKSFGDPVVSPLLNGVLFTVTYPDEVQLSLALDSFLLGSDLVTMVDMAINPDSAVFGAGDNTLTFTPSSSAVPIPSSLLLLGGGLIGLIAYRRKARN